MKCYKMCYYAGIFLLIAFPVKLIKDYIVYTTTLNSAPFYLWVLVDGLCYLLPAAILVLLGKYLKKRANQ